MAPALIGLTSLLLLLPFSGANSLFPSSSVVELSDRSWASSTSGSQRGTTLVLFYAPWCPHCQRFSAHWKALARRFAASDRLHFAAANCVDTQLCARHGVPSGCVSARELRHLVGALAQRRADHVLRPLIAGLPWLRQLTKVRNAGLGGLMQPRLA